MEASRASKQALTEEGKLNDEEDQFLNEENNDPEDNEEDSEEADRIENLMNNLGEYQ